MTINVRQWLGELGLERYVPEFVAGGIEAETLPFLTDAHLREIGIPVGPRIKLRAAISRLGANGDADSNVERRHMTVMFADLVGSTPLSTRLDPEELREVIRSFHGTVDSEVARFDTFVAQYKGDGALVYFGYPRAHEDDAERAISAALAITLAVGALKTPAGIPLAVHIGIATGLTVVGDTFGHSDARERAAIGETPNLAARLVDLAGSGQIVVSERTRSLASHQFVFEDLGLHTLKGLARPVAAYRVTAELPAETRFDARYGASVSTMVGRSNELKTLIERWERARGGNGQVVLVSGEAGIGKSRLVRALELSLGTQPRARVTNQCSPHHTSSAFYPMIRQLSRAANFHTEDDATVQGQKLRQLLRGADAVDIALTAQLVGLENELVGNELDLTPAQQRRHTFEALIRHLERTAIERPVLWLLEDAHWIDPTTLELVELCVERIAKLPVLALITYRSEFSPRFLIADHVSTLRLSRLARSDVAALMENLCRTKPVDRDAVELVATRTDGVPLFVEELTKSLLDVGELVEKDGVFGLAGPIQRLTVPASLHDSLMARLDRHRIQKEVAQIASCIGREFDLALLDRVAGLPSDTVRVALVQLKEAELILEHGTAKERHFVFKHALVRDAAYESLLRRKREELHARILAVLEQAPDVPAESLARHSASAGFTDRAIDLWRRASASAMARGAFAEAVAHLHQALLLNAGAQKDTNRQAQRLDLLLALGQATMPLRGYSHSESVDVFLQAHALALSLDDGLRLFWVSYARWVIYYVRGEHTTAQEIARAMLEQALGDQHVGRTLTAVRALGISEMITGGPLTADATFARAERLAEQSRQQPRERRLASAQRFAADPEIATQFHLALTAWALGRVDDARDLSESAVEAARSMGHIHTLGHALTHGAIVAVVDRDAARAIDHCEEVAQLADKHDMELWRGYGGILHGYAQCLDGSLTRGVELLQDGLKRLGRTETRTMVPMHRAVLAWALMREGRFAQAKAHESAVQDELSNGCERYFWIDQLIWLGRCRLLAPIADRPGAHELLESAVREARRQGAVAWELRAATALGELWCQEGQRERARDMVEPILARLVQGRTSTLRIDAVRLLSVSATG